MATDGSLEDRITALEVRLDIVADEIRGDLKALLEAVTAGNEELRRTTDAIHKESEIDRRLTRLILSHTHRLRALGGRRPDSVA